MRLTEESAALRPRSGRTRMEEEGSPGRQRSAALDTSGLPPSRLAVNPLSLPQRRAPACRHWETGIRPRRVVASPEHRLRRTVRPQRLRGLEDARRHRGRHALVDHEAELGLVVPRPLLLGRFSSGPPGALLETSRRDRHRPGSRPAPSCSRAPRLGRGGRAGVHIHTTISFIGRRAGHLASEAGEQTTAEFSPFLLS